MCMERLVIKDHAFQQSGDKIILRGVSFPDPCTFPEKEKWDIRKALSYLKTNGANVVRIPVLPGRFHTDVASLKKVLDDVVLASQDLQLFCILDWHAIGNPHTNQTRLTEQVIRTGETSTPKFLADFQIAKEGITWLTTTYGMFAHVLFELYNEPAPGKKAIPQRNLEALPDENWFAQLDQLVKIARKHTKNVLLVAPPLWAFDLEFFNAFHIAQPDIAYTFHVYPFKNHQSWMERIDKSNARPLVITEWGYDDDASSQYYALPAFGENVLKFCKERKLSWTAWCLSTSWRPCLLKKTDPIEFTSFGTGVFDQLKSADK